MVGKIISFVDRFIILPTTILFFAFACCANQAGAQGDKLEPPRKNFSVHEWGVFTVPRGGDWLKQDMLAEWQSFPEFFHGTLPNRDLAYRGPVTKPVIFLHDETGEKFQLELLIRFRDGQPLIWWPPVEHPANPSYGLNLPAQWHDAHPDSILRYGLTLNEKGRTEVVPKDHWLNALRKVDASRIMVSDSYSNFRSREDHRISEPFIYYDGLMKRPPVPQVTRTSDGISLTTDSNHDWLDVVLIERSLDGASLSVAEIDRIAAGQHQQQVALKAIDSKDFSQFVVQFRKSLVDAGLHDDEAQSLLDVWSEGLFQRPGLTLLYRIPQDTYDHWIPLHFNPHPESIVRVGLVLHQHLEPELSENVTRLISELGSDEYQVRVRAEKQLYRIGGAALPEIQKIAASKDVETAARARQLIENLDTDELLQKVMTRYQKKKQDK